MYQSRLSSASALSTLAPLPPPVSQAQAQAPTQPSAFAAYTDWAEDLWSQAPLSLAPPLGHSQQTSPEPPPPLSAVAAVPSALGNMGGAETSGALEQPPRPSLPGPPVSPGLCVICGDRATGRHYGANSCDGCKGFFRRTIRKSQAYVCRFEKRCLIDKDKRNSCRYCRFAKCVEAGMRPDAVQSERDRIQTRRLKSASGTPVSSPTTRGPPSSIAAAALPFQFAFAQGPPSPLPANTPAPFHETIRTLMKAEEYYTASQHRGSVITRTDNGAGEAVIATMADISESMRQQLLLMVEWAKTLSPFAALPMPEQVCLLRAYAAQHLLLCVAYRSRGTEDRLLLTNATCLPRSRSASDISDANHVTVRALEELVKPIKLLGVDEVEFVCIRAVVFFNPLAKGLEESVGVVGETRQTILGALYHHIGTKAGAADPFRFANLLLLLPPLQAIAQNLREDLQLASMFGMARIDALLQELLISDGDGAASAETSESVGDSLLFPHISLLNDDEPSNQPPPPPIPLKTENTT